MKMNFCACGLEGICRSNATRSRSPSDQPPRSKRFLAFAPPATDHGDPYLDETGAEDLSTSPGVNQRAKSNNNKPEFASDEVTVSVVTSKEAAPSSSAPSVSVTTSAAAAAAAVVVSASSGAGSGRGSTSGTLVSFAYKCHLHIVLIFVIYFNVIVTLLICIQF